MARTLTQTVPYIILIISILALLSSTAQAQFNSSTSNAQEVPTTGQGSLPENLRDPNATTPTVPSNAGDAREKFKTRAETIRTQAQTRAAASTEETRQAHVSQQAELRIRTVIGTVQTRIAGAVERIGSIADRMEAYAFELESRGLDVSRARAHIADARTELRSASAIVNEELPAEVEAALTSEDPQTTFQYVKESMRQAAEHIRSAQESLRSALTALKSAVTNQ